MAAPKIGEKIGEKPDKEAAAKKDESDLRHRICENGPCKEPAPKPEPSTETDLRRPVCVKEPCPCPPGHTANKSGCVPTVGNQPADQCLPGQIWNGGSCLPSGQCPAGRLWNGSTCQADCSIVNARTANAILQVRSARQERDDACQQNPSGASCQQLDGHYQNALAEYRNLWAAAPAECRSMLPTPDSL